MPQGGRQHHGVARSRRDGSLYLQEHGAPVGDGPLHEVAVQFGGGLAGQRSHLTERGGADQLERRGARDAAVGPHGGPHAWHPAGQQVPRRPFHRRDAHGADLVDGRRAAAVGCQFGLHQDSHAGAAGLDAGGLEALQRLEGEHRRPHAAQRLGHLVVAQLGQRGESPRPGTLTLERAGGAGDERFGEFGGSLGDLGRQRSVEFAAQQHHPGGSRAAPGQLVGGPLERSRRGGQRDDEAVECRQPGPPCPGEVRRLGPDEGDLERLGIVQPDDPRAHRMPGRAGQCRLLSRRR